jgi:hypothetical protein
MRREELALLASSINASIARSHSSMLIQRGSLPPGQLDSLYFMDYPYNLFGWLGFANIGICLGG